MFNKDIIINNEKKDLQLEETIIESCNQLFHNQFVNYVLIKY